MSSATATKSAFQVVPGVDELRRPIFSVLLKRSYDIRPGQIASRAAEDRSLLEGSQYRNGGDPETATVLHESDLAPYKLLTDVVVIGKAYAPKGRPVPQMDCAVGVGRSRKVIRVIGDRKCMHRAGRAPSWTDPGPFQEMELCYERAYGGADLRSDPAIPFYYPRNTKGCGIALKNIAEVVQGLKLPNFEDPQDLLTPDRVVLEGRASWNRQPLPQGFGWFETIWYPRCSFVGAVPGDVDLAEPMREEALGLVPKGQIALARQFKLPSFDVRFNNGASPGLAMPHLAGNERIALSGLTPDGSLEFDLPGETPRIVLDISLGETELKSVLHTVSIRLEEMQVDLVWRGAQEYPGIDWLPEMKHLRVAID
jgi:hypothetical protein